MKIRTFSGIVIAAVALAAAGCERETATVAYDAPERPGGTAVSHSISGTVSQIDSTEGLLTLRTDTATMRLPFNPGTMGEIRDGENVTVRMTLTRAGDPKSQAFDAPAPRYVPDGAMPSGEDQIGHRSVTGTVKDLDRDEGTFTLESDDGGLAMYFPPQGIAELKDGDRVTLYAVFTRGT
jgi:hypothetical protein